MRNISFAKITEISTQTLYQMKCISEFSLTFRILLSRQQKFASRAIYTKQNFFYLFQKSHLISHEHKQKNKLGKKDLLISQSHIISPEHQQNEVKHLMKDLNTKTFRPKILQSYPEECDSKLQVKFLNPSYI